MKRLAFTFVFLLSAVPCLAGIIVVDDDGPADFNNIQAAIDYSSNGDYILVFPGTYTGTGNRDIDFLGRAITVRSVDPNDPIIVASTIINCSGLGRGFYFHSSEDANSIVSGLTITNGYIKYYGAGIFCDESSPTINNCRFISNSASYAGGGIAVMYNSPNVVNCEFIGNSASMGGAIYNFRTEDTLTVLNCSFNGNTAGDGGGMYNFYCSPTVINCTFNANSAASDNTGGMLNWHTSSPVVTNCIFWGNFNFNGNTDEAAQLSDGTPVINYCCVEGWTGALGGTGNFGDDPLFIESLGADNIPGTGDENPRLLAGSPCLDAGDNSSVPPSLTEDLDGNPRIINGTVDMGAYEGPKQGFLISSQSVTVPESQTAEFTVALAIDPLETVLVTVAHHSGDSDITVQSGTSLTFNSSNYSDPQTVTLAAADDEDYLHGKALIWVSADEFVTAAIEATEVDDDIPALLYVDANAPGDDDGTSWENAFTSLQDALSIAAEYHIYEILVAQGTYKPDQGINQTPGDQGAAFQLINGLSLKGSYAGFGRPDPNARDIELYETILSGDLNGNDAQLTDPADMWQDPNRQDNSESVVTASGTTDANTAMDGFTITAGHNGNAGAGMYNQDANLTVTNCTFKWNSAEHGAGIINWNSTPEFINCKFESNAAAEGAGMSNLSSNPVLTDCTFRSNIAMYSNGGAILGGAPEINNCTFTENVAEKGGALYNCDGPIINCSFADNAACWEEGYSQGGGLFGCDGNIVNCTITGNSAEGRGGGLAYCNGPITNCTIANNTSDEDGGGLFSCNNTITNCTIAGNSAGFFGGGGLTDCSGTIKNCTITGNTAEDGGGLFGCNATITNCTIAGNYAYFSGGGIAGSDGNIVNCTVTENTAEDGGGIFWCDGTITNCIIWNNSAEQHSQLYLYFHAELTYSCIQDFNDGGLGNISADPCFVEPGFWVDANDPNIIVEPNDPNAAWVNGDYHLKSEGWRWDAARQRWTWDDVTSRCIDAGNPGSSLADEPLSVPDDPNNIWGQNLRINMGAFGGTAEASIPPYDWALLADLTNDGIVDLTDYAYQALDWLNSADQQPGDLNRDGLIDTADLALLTEDWLMTTTWHEN